MRNFLPLPFLRWAAIPLALAACGTPEAHLDSMASTGATPFTQALADEYSQLASSEYRQMDWPDQKKFKEKANAARRGYAPSPENPAALAVGTGIQLNPEVDYGKVQRGEAIEARSKLLSALQGDAPQRNPQASARAQVAYDCWVEQLEEGWQKSDIDRCRQAFYTALDQAQARPVAQVPQPAQPQVSALDNLQIYFPFDSAQLPPAARNMVAKAGQALRDRPGSIEVTGHTDKVGSQSYNERLSAQRAQAVKDVLVAQGVSPDRIDTQAKGESDPLVPTPDNVRQPQNRRAVIGFD